MTAPRLLRPLVRTRARLSLTLGLVLTALIASLLPWFVGGPDDDAQATRNGTAKAEQAGDGPRDEAEAVAEARRTGKEVLVETATTATAQTWALPGGRMRTQIHAAPQRAKTADGRWAPIDTDLRRTEDRSDEGDEGAGAGDGLGISPVNPVLPVRFADGGGGRTDEDGRDRADRSYRRGVLADGDGNGSGAGNGDTVLAEVELGGHTVAYTWPGSLPEPVLDGPRALYQEVLPGVDLLLVAREEGGFAQLLILKNREAADHPALRTLDYGLRSDTAEFEHDAETDTVRVLDPKTGDEIGSVPTPFAWDSSGQESDLAPGAETRTSTATAADVLKLSGLSGIEPGARSSSLRTALERDGSGVRLSLDVAGAGLLGRDDVRYPLFVDPTLNPGWKAWTVAYKPYPNSSFYNGTNFNSGTSDARVGYENETRGTARSFWRMEFPSSAKGATVTKATFKVLNNHSWSCEKRQFKLYRTGAISSGTTWNKQPSWTDHLQDLSFAHGNGDYGCSDEYVAWDVEDAAQYAADAAASTVTLGMRASDETSVYTWRKFRATSATIQLVYNRKPNEPKNGKTTPGGACMVTPQSRPVGKTNIRLTATATDPDGNLHKLRFRWWKSGDATPSGTLVTPNSSGTASLDIPSSKLTDKTTYKWDVRAEDSEGALSSYFPPGTSPCQFTVDASAPSKPEIVSEDFDEATDDGATWTSKKFGQSGSFTVTSAGATKIRYGFAGNSYTEVNATQTTDDAGNPVGTVTLTLKPPNAGPNALLVYARDAVGNQSERADYVFYLPPSETADGPGDVGGDGIPDLLTINASGNLRSYPGIEEGELYTSLAAGYTSDGKLNPPGHWYDPATGKAALITKYGDAYPGDGITDLFARTPDGGFWLYPGDGYGSFDVDERLRVRLPAGTPDPAKWLQIKAVGDVTGDERPDLFLRTGDSFWALLGYTGGSFQQAVELHYEAWADRDIVNVADIDLDGTPDLLWRNTVNGNMYVRHGKPGAVGGSVDLGSLKTAAVSREGKDTVYGTSWTAANVDTVIGIPDVNGDRIPDLWARFADTGNVKVYHPSKTNTNAPVKTVISSDWSAVKAFG
ncbi:hypothetical protein GCM10010145_16750 [Streptomyces ruber]|uniref:DNRLRE domain-containing protein n=2 Tax=Streptomyces TaxID=1883 RepID=A0A918BCK9_9ACTN|nr:DNRLRE domain-containing protein [Streptomyces ruber]GGQ48648.1 hypothetical protein GCM10010145_16750 [Streptomyces ruber]